MIEKRTIVKFVLTIVIVVFVLVVVSGYYVYLIGKNNGYDKGFEDGHKKGLDEGFEDGKRYAAIQGHNEQVLKDMGILPEKK